MSTRTARLVPILLWPVVAAALSFLFEVNILGSIILFFVIPSVYLSFFAPRFIFRSLVFALVGSVPISIIFDYIMQATNGWAVTKPFSTFKIFTHITPEQPVWLFFALYFLVMFYEVFLERYRHSHLISAMGRSFFFRVLVLMGVFFFVYRFFPAFLEIDLFYAKGGVLFFLLPLALLLPRIRVSWKKFLFIGSYCFYHSAVYQFTALSLDLWSYPARDQFLAHVSMFGFVFPIEEVIFWFIFGPLVTVAAYEYFYDDGK